MGVEGGFQTMAGLGDNVCGNDLVAQTCGQKAKEG